MRKIHIIVIVIWAMWGAAPVGHGFRSLFASLQGDSLVGGPTAQADPEDTDPAILNLPPPR
jgi:hypothetical protein